jgi:hypothetical protein
MKRTLLRAGSALALTLASLVSSCAAAVVGAAAAGGYVISQKVLPGNIHTAQVALDVDQVWPNVKETIGFFQEPGSAPTVQDYPRSVQAKVDGAKVQVDVDALDIDRTTIRVSADRTLSKDDATAEMVLQKILKRLDEIEKPAKPAEAAKTEKAK